MKKLTLIAILLISIIFYSDAKNYNSYIIKFKNSNSKNIEELQNNGKIKGVFGNLLINNKFDNKLLNANQNQLMNELSLYFVFNSNDDLNTLNQLESNDNVEYIIPNYIYTIEQLKNKPNDEKYSEQWGLKEVKAESAWNIASGKGVIVGVIDTGIDFNHPDLKNQLWINSKEDINKNGAFDAWSISEVRNGISGDLNGIDDDGNGVIDDVIGYDFVDQSIANFGDFSNPDAIPEDQNEHGTLVSGIIAAERNNKIGISGLAYNAKILTAKAFDASGNAESDDIARSIVYAVLNGAKVLNFSFGESFESPIVYSAIRFANLMGVVIAASSGNNNWTLPHYPSDYQEIISVGGSNDKHKRASNSNYGYLIDIVAPGQDIMTTSPNDNYKSVGGTSMAAPHIAAVAALLLEVNPNLSPENVKSILQSSANNENGWTYDMAAGIVDAASALNNIAIAETNITYPINEQLFYIDKLENINLIGTLSNPLFDSVEVVVRHIATGIENKYAAGNKQIVNDTILTIPKSAFLNDTINILGNFVLKSVIYLKNGKFLEKNIVISIDSSSRFKINSFKVLNPIFNDKRVVLVAGVASMKSSMKVAFREKGTSDKFQYATQFDSKSNNCYVIIDDIVNSGVTYQAIAYFINNSNDTISREFEFTRWKDNYHTANFVRKSFGLNRAYLHNQTSNLYSDGKKSIVINDLGSLAFGKTYSFEFDKNGFTLVDSLVNGLLPVGYGDSNGDGIQEVLLMGGYKSAIYQVNSSGGNLFENKLFESPTNKSFWGDKLFDIDKDGKEDIIAYRNDPSERSYFIYSYKNGKYDSLTTAALPESFKNRDLSKSCIVADLDNDGNYELGFANESGQLFIYKFIDNKLKFQFIDSTIFSQSSQMLETIDIDGDGKQEIIQLNYGSRELYDANAQSESIWTIRILKHTENDTYQEIYKDFIWGVRAGFTKQGWGFRNGLTKGNIDDKSGDEIIISTFPNLYALKWNNESKKLENFWYYPSALSNSAIIDDFDGNGINELGISTFNSTIFFEFERNFAGPDVPNDFDGWALSDTTCQLNWSAVSNAEEYQIFSVNLSNNSANLISTTKNNYVNFSGLTKGNFYDFVIKSYNSKLNPQFSDFTEIVTIYANAPIFITEVRQLNNNQFQVKFNGRIADNMIEPSLFSIINIDNQTNEFAGLTNKLSDSVLMVTFNFSQIENGVYTFQAKSFRDYYKNWTLESNLNFDYKQIEIKEEIYLTKLDIYSSSLMKIWFSEEVDKTTAETLENYVLKPYGTVISIDIDEFDTRGVIIHIADELKSRGARGYNYTITAQNIISANGKPITKGSGNSLGFTLSMNELDDVYISPNPIKYKEEPTIRFSNLSPKATIKVMNLEGKILAEITENDGNGGAEWNGLDSNGKQLETGIYMFEVEGYRSDGTRILPVAKKFAVLP